MYGFTLSIRPGLVFDEMPPQQTASKTPRNSFGSKKIGHPDKHDQKPKLTLKKKTDIGNLFHSGKENSANKSLDQGETR